MKDFFISYTKADRAWAEWIAWQLEDLGYEAVIDVWDFSAGHNFVVEMQRAMTEAKRTISILSPEYLAATYTTPEWAAAIKADPKGEDRKLIPIKVKAVENTGFFDPILHIDLIGISKTEAKKILQKKIKASVDGSRPNKPINEPVFPPDKQSLEPPSPSQSVTDKKFILQNKSSNKKEESLTFKAGLVDKIEQVTHILEIAEHNFFIPNEQPNAPLAFLLYGEITQWPHALSYILYKEIIKTTANSPPIQLEYSSPEPITLDDRMFRKGFSPEEYLWQLIGEKLTCRNTKVDIEHNLKGKTVPIILFRKLLNNEYDNHELVRGMIEAWESLTLPACSPRHVLIFYYEYSNKPKWKWLPWVKNKKSLIYKMNKFTPKELREKHLLPEIKSPNKKLIHEWVDNHFKHSERKKICDFIENKIRDEFERRKKGKKAMKEDLQRIRITENDIEIHHEDLKDILIEALKTFG